MLITINNEFFLFFYFFLSFICKCCFGRKTSFTKESNVGIYNDNRSKKDDFLPVNTKEIFRMIQHIINDMSQHHETFSSMRMHICTHSENGTALDVRVVRNHGVDDCGKGRRLPKIDSSTGAVG